ncbi:D-alanine--D-alanine ligase [Formicincola oecophyllae]|uniref:D-alanine--D-alanine ligase n=1 Tax=Formicincola oecophyllae TaxID=2558361 RepID=A0A4Y6UAT5_9PROT|nr:D-alanine--D-alanine ligase [Formicincola oecophyllae]
MGSRQLSLFEFWPDKLFYAPVALYWAWLACRHGGLATLTAANPRIFTGGLVGESKSAVLALAGLKARAAIAPWGLFQAGPHGVGHALSAMQRAGLRFPVVVKPDVGCNGVGVRRVDNEAALAHVVGQFRPGVKLMVQKLLTEPLEAGVFYVRSPGAARGRITSLTYKETPFVVGDGQRTLRELVMADPRMGLLPHLYLPRWGSQADEILPKGVKKTLVFAGNHCKGAVFRDGRADITPELEKAMETILGDIPDFHFGRVDLKAPSVAALRRGEGLQLIEINGVGSEAIHIWDKNTTLREAYKAQFWHYRQAFLIGRQNRKAGWKSAGAFKMLWAWLHQKRLSAHYPPND